MKREFVGAAFGAGVVALLSEERREWARGALGRLARGVGAFGETQVAAKLLLKKVAGSFDDAGVPFLLAGGGACWVRGGPFPKDFDLVVAPDDVERARDVLAAAGMRIVRRPEQWLFQAYEHGIKIDVLFRPIGVSVGELFRRADQLEVDGVQMKVICLEDVFAWRLLAITEDTAYRFERHIPSARALREQVDWAEVEERTATSPFARAFFTLLRGLGVVPLEPTDEGVSPFQLMSERRRAANPAKS